MKTTRLLGVSLLATATFLGACDNDDDDDNGTGPTNTATVRFVNTSGQNIDVGMNGTYGAANSNVAYGNATSCMTVNTGSSSGLTFRQNGQTSTFTPTNLNTANFQNGQVYTVVLGNGTTAGSYNATTYTDTYNGASATMGGVRVINATGGNTNYNLYVGPAGTTRPTTASNANFGSAIGTAFMPFATGNNQVWLTTGTGNSQTDAFSSSPFSVAANGYTTYVVGPSATGSTALRGFTVGACR
jgi:hypothetical protein